ncbi:hypothetical protein AGMMS50230_01990 [Spirochaetia bacterium]|nr:hypothetical protein AGMMS50230_01990 [Spirochaetia bacterium]
MMWKNGNKENNKKMEYAQTTHNRTVYAAPAVAGLAYEKTQSAYGLCALFSPAHFCGCWKPCGFLYRNRKNVIYSRYVMRNLALTFSEKHIDNNVNKQYND